jgi:hypothetical protein
LHFPELVEGEVGHKLVIRDKARLSTQCHECLDAGASGLLDHDKGWGKRACSA